MITEIDGRKIEYGVRKSRKATRPRIDHRNGEFTVVVPEGVDLDAGELIKRKKDWVIEKKEEYRELKHKVPERDLEEGGTVRVLGDRKQIKFERSRSNRVEEDIFLASHLAERTSIKDQLEKALREKAREEFESKIKKYSPKIDGEPEKIFIRDQKTRWGSCSSKGNLNFNWRLVLGPEHVFEYVAVHELVHLEEKNHSDRFWSRVEQLYPEYQRSKSWLSENSHRLLFDPDFS